MRKLKTLLLAAAATAVACPALALSSGFAVVGTDGSLVRGDGVANVTRNGQGSYTVEFVHTVKSCAFTATTGLTGSVGDPPNGLVTVAGAHDDPKGVYVATFDGTGNAADMSFHLNVRC